MVTHERKGRTAGMGIAGEAGMEVDPFAVTFCPCEVTVVERAEGYREFRCLPATWSYPGHRPVAAFLTELYSAQMGADPHGTGAGSDFWSGSDAALRLRQIPYDDLAMREIVALASRRLLGLNAPRPWASEKDIWDLAVAWEPEATDIHFSQLPVDDGPTSLWAGYGMERSLEEPIIFGWGMRASERPAKEHDAAERDGAPGKWYAWSTLLGWDRWPRRQHAERMASVPTPGTLPLFVSHRWESLSHPDPAGSQLLALKVGLTISLAASVLQLSAAGPAERTISGLPELMGDFLRRALPPSIITNPQLATWAQRVRDAAQEKETEETFSAVAADLERAAVQPVLEAIRRRVLVWYDYASMFQAPRSAEEEKAFRRELLELNDIQRGAGTLVIAGDAQYQSRAWCFFELCGGMRRRIVELVPSWGRRVAVGASVTRWASKSDQLIGALAAFGPGAINRSGLDTTHVEDLPDIARLLADLPVTGLIETDDSDLVGGAIPIPLRTGAWVLPAGGRDVLASETRSSAPLPALGRIPPNAVLRRAADMYASADTIEGPAGMWFYTTQRILTLAWASRAHEVWKTLQRELAAGGAAADWAEPLSAPEPSVACLWADARALADDGEGWTRAVPSAVPLLVVVTQADVPRLCWIYDLVVRAHLAAGSTVITYTPDTGGVLLYRPGEPGGPTPVARRSDVLAVPRLRRSDVRASSLFVGCGSRLEDIEVLAALRLDPAEGFVPPGQVSEDAAAGGFGAPGEEITPVRLLTYSQARVRAEALARGSAATWDSWCRPRLHQGAWQVGMAVLQVHIIEQLVRKVCAVSANPFRRRKLLHILVEEHEGYALPPSILDDADAIIELIRQKQEDLL